MVYLQVRQSDLNTIQGEHHPTGGQHSLSGNLVKRRRGLVSVSESACTLHSLWWPVVFGVVGSLARGAPHSDCYHSDDTGYPGPRGWGAPTGRRGYASAGIRPSNLTTAKKGGSTAQRRDNDHKDKHQLIAEVFTVGFRG